MILSYNFYGGQTVLSRIPTYGNGTNIASGAIVMKGATTNTNQGFAIVGASGFAGVLGLMTTLHVAGAAGSDSKEDGTKYGQEQVLINDDAIYMADNVVPATAAIACTSVSTTTVNMSTIEGSLGGGWLWGSDNQLQWIQTSTANTSVITATSSAWTSATTFAKIVPRFYTLVAFSTDATKIQNAGGAGSAKVVIFQNYLRASSIPLQSLDPTKHSGVTYNSTLIVSSEIRFRDHALQTDNY